MEPTNNAAIPLIDTGTTPHDYEPQFQAHVSDDTVPRARAASGLPTVTVDLALHIGEVLYGNVGATDRLDFIVIGPAVTRSRASKRCASRCAILYWSPRSLLLHWAIPVTA
jgi:hypothetical protein